MTDIIHIPLNRLALWKGNVRKTDIQAGVNELAESIASHGLLQSLVVRKGKKGKHDIVAGQRRYLALQALAKDGRIKKDCPVPCMLADENVDAAELSLAENVVRMAMHPADQFEAFRDLIDGGATITDVAARFGVTETVVAKRLKLGRLSPVILEAYREGNIDLEAAQAFAVGDDHEAQERVLADLSEWNRAPHHIRELLTEDEVSTSDRRVRFVGIDAYRAAGGTMRLDLFDDENSGYVQDVALLDRLVSEKLAAIRLEQLASGWSWVDIVPDADWQTIGRFSRVYAERAPLSEADQAELDRLSQAYDELVDDDDADEDRLAEIEERMDALQDGPQIWPAATLAIAGAIVAIDYRGNLKIEHGLVRKEDAHKLAADTDLTVDAGEDRPSRADGLSPRLIEDLTAQHSAAIGAELMGRPDIAFAAVVHSMALEVFYPRSMSDSCLKLSARSAHLSTAMASPDSCKGLTVIAQERERFGGRLPGTPEHLWNWLLERSRDALLDLLAFIAAESVDAVQRKGERPDSSRLVHARALAGALQLDMTAWFSPTAESYFSRINRAQIIAAIDEANGSHAPALDKLKKSELAIRAEQLVAGKAWLPKPLRAAVNDNTDDAQTEAAE